MCIAFGQFGSCFDYHPSLGAVGDNKNATMSMKVLLGIIIKIITSYHPVSSYGYFITHILS